MIAEHVAAKFEFLMQEAPKCGQFNKKVSMMTWNNLLVHGFCATNSTLYATLATLIPLPMAEYSKQVSTLLHTMPDTMLLHELDLTVYSYLPVLQVKYTTEGDIILEEKRDYMGNLVSVVIFDGMTNLQETIMEESKLRAMDIIEEEVGAWPRMEAGCHSGTLRSLLLRLAKGGLPRPPSFPVKTSGICWAVW
jgi:hypothetical protein